jgi:hypothetical protein
VDGDGAPEDRPATEQAPSTSELAPPTPPMPLGAGSPAGAPSPTNGFAVASLVLGILAVVLCWTIYLGIGLGVLAIVFGALGIGRARALAANRGMAVAGLVLGIAGVVLSLVLILLVVTFFTHSGSFQQLRDCWQHPNTC